MNASLHRFFRLKPGESGLVLALGCLLGCNLLAVQVSYIASVSGFLSQVGVNQFLMLSLLALAIGDTIIEFRFLSVSENTFTSLDQYQTFYGLYRLVLTLSACTIQALIPSRLLTNLTLKNVFLILPMAILTGLVWLIVMPGLVSGIGAVLLARLSWDTIDESARKNLSSSGS
jgi:hypothetical protein